MDERLTTSELAERVGVTTRTLKAWRKEGMPYQPRGGGKEYLHAWPEVRQWLMDNERAGHVPQDV